jgi:hypothetical protein
MSNIIFIAIRKIETSAGGRALNVCADSWNSVIGSSEGHFGTRICHHSTRPWRRILVNRPAKASVHHLPSALTR